MKNHKLAWQKLYNFAEKKDENRTFAMFKLLANNLTTQAVKYHLKADIYLAFNQKKEATFFYLKAAQLFLSENKYKQAIAIYTHLKYLEPQNITYHLKLIEIYFMSNNKNKIKSSVDLLKIYFKSNKSEINEFIQKFIIQYSKQITDNNLSSFIFQFLNTIQKS